MSECSIVILAAGIGSRMQSHTPKVMQKICGQEMIYYSIKEAQKISDDVSVILYHHADNIKDFIEKNFKHIHCIIQEYEQLPGTGGAIISFLKQYTPKYERLIVLNGDMPLIQSTDLLPFSTYDQNDIVMSVLQLQDGSGYGRVNIENGHIKSIIEEKDATCEQKQITTVNAGVYCFPITILNKYLPLLSNQNAQQEYYLTDVIALAIQDQQVLKPLYVQENHFKGVNTKLDLSDAENIMLERIRQKWLKQGVIMHQRQSIYIDEQVNFIGECELEMGVQITGKSTINESKIKAHSVIEESEIIQSDIGPFAHIRPSSKIIQTHIGNFVETKKAELYKVKAGHLSYLGDCFIDENTNIGAGVITCNYDGKSKHQTRIGKNVFVGSDTQLIAPVTIEDHTIIAAGSTITKDVPQGSLAISRVEQNCKENFYYPYFDVFKIKVNGEYKVFKQQMSLLDMILSLGIDSKVLAVALNANVIQKEQWSTCYPKENDELELLHFVGGGSDAQ